MMKIRTIVQPGIAGMDRKGFKPDLARLVRRGWHSTAKETLAVSGMRFCRQLFAGLGVSSKSEKGKESFLPGCKAQALLQFLVCVLACAKANLLVRV